MSAQEPRVVGLIPARMGSSRFPGKPLAAILGLPMIEHVYRRAAMCRLLQGIYIATCDPEIYEVAQGFGGSPIMTSPSHVRASDRVAEAARSLDAEIIVMIQGDEPMLFPEMIEQAVAPLLADPRVQCVNLVKPLRNEDEYLNTNTIKVVMDREDYVLYFSREPIPTRRLLSLEQIPVFKQVCIIPFRRDLLLTYAQLEPSPLEQAESIDMLRLLEHGYKILSVETDFDTYAVDTPEDLAKVEELLRHDPLTRRYIKETAGDSQV